MIAYYIVSQDMNEYYVERIVVPVTGNNRKVVSYHQSSETAWNSAERKAIDEAQKAGHLAVYTTAPQDIIDLISPDDPRPRACWIVRPRSGRPPLHGEPLIKTALWLRQAQVDWLKAQTGTMAETVRQLIDSAMS